MTREEFIDILDGEHYSYKIEGGKVIVTEGGNVNLIYLTSLPPGVVFEGEGHVNLISLTSLPPGVEFKNGGNVYLRSLTSLHSGVEFKNGGSVRLNSLVGGYFIEWQGNIKGIDNKRLLNLMISKGVFI